MKIAILDVVPKMYWAQDEGRNDGVKFKAMLSALNIDAELTVHCLTENDWPENTTDYDAYLLTGSPCSANEEYEWTSRFTDLIDDIIRREIRLVGICFGHQYIAKHLGGTVIRSESGWLIGLHPISVIDHQPWMTPQQTDTQIYYFNQDQIATLPIGAKHIARAQNCEYAAWRLDDRIFCLQGHPEQPISSMRNFIKSSHGVIDRKVLDAGEQSMREASPDADIWARWIANFFMNT